MNDESACGKGVLYDINLYVCVCTGCVCGVGGGGAMWEAESRDSLKQVQ